MWEVGNLLSVQVCKKGEDYKLNLLLQKGGGLKESGGGGVFGYTHGHRDVATRKEQAGHYFSHEICEIGFTRESVHP